MKTNFFFGGGGSDLSSEKGLKLNSGTHFYFTLEKSGIVCHYDKTKQFIGGHIHCFLLLLPRPEGVYINNGVLME